MLAASTRSLSAINEPLPLPLFLRTVGMPGLRCPVVTIIDQHCFHTETLRIITRLLCPSADPGPRHLNHNGFAKALPHCHRHWLPACLLCRRWTFAQCLRHRALLQGRRSRCAPVAGCRHDRFATFPDREAAEIRPGYPPYIIECTVRADLLSREHGTFVVRVPFHDHWPGDTVTVAESSMSPIPVGKTHRGRCKSCWWVLT